MKKVKFIFPLCLAIVLGFLSARMVYGLYKQPKNENTSFHGYFLQLGVYKNKSSLEEVTRDLEAYLIEELDEKYYLYVGITTQENNARKIQNLYKEKGISLYIKKLSIKDNEFYNHLEQFDILLDGASKPEDIISISKVILSTYQEMVLDIRK